MTCSPRFIHVNSGEMSAFGPEFHCPMAKPANPMSLHSKFCGARPVMQRRRLGGCFGAVFDREESFEHGFHQSSTKEASG